MYTDGTGACPGVQPTREYICQMNNQYVILDWNATTSDKPTIQRGELKLISRAVRAYAASLEVRLWLEFLHGC